MAEVEAVAAEDGECELGLCINTNSRASFKGPLVKALKGEEGGKVVDWEGGRGTAGDGGQSEQGEI